MSTGSGVDPPSHVVFYGADHLLSVPSDLRATGYSIMRVLVQRQADFKRHTL